MVATRTANSCLLPKAIGYFLCGPSLLASSRLISPRQCPRNNQLFKIPSYAHIAQAVHLNDPSCSNPSSVKSFVDS